MCSHTTPRKLKPTKKNDKFIASLLFALVRGPPIKRRKRRRKKFLNQNKLIWRRRNALKEFEKNMHLTKSEQKAGLFQVPFSRLPSLVFASALSSTLFAKKKLRKEMQYVLSFSLAPFLNKMGAFWEGMNEFK